MAGLDARIGTTIAGYRVEAQLARRGTGSDYVAQAVVGCPRVLLRLLAPELSGDERFRERFLQVSGLVAALDHPSILPVHEAGEADGYLYVAMRSVEGADLASVLAREGRLEPERVLAIRARDGRVDLLSLPWLNISFPAWVPYEGGAFFHWLEAEHPEAGGPFALGKLFRTNGQELVHTLTPESLDLLAGYLDEYERSVTARADGAG